jgi:hypothetical protein
MSFGRSSLYAACVAAGAALLAGCGLHGASTLPFAATPSVSTVLPEAKLRDCKGQQNFNQYATLTITLLTSGGSVCIPTFGGFGGSVKYPSVNPSVQLTLTSSTTNYNNMPELGSGTPIFYLQLALSGGTTFGKKAKAGGGLTSKSITPGQTYTAFGQAVVYGFKFNFKPCYTVATKGKYGGVIGGIGSLLKGQSVPVAASGVIEIYSGQQASLQC